MQSISVPELALWRNAEFPHTLIDVRRKLRRNEDGVALVGETGTALTQIGDYVARIDTNVDAIATAARYLKASGAPAFAWFSVASNSLRWTAGQLEQEIADNAWLIIPADSDIIFDLTHAEKWQSATAKIGIKPWQLTNEAGHA